MTDDDVKRCRWCGRYFLRRETERPANFRKRQCCDRSCAVSLQNHRRAKEARRS